MEERQFPPGQTEGFSVQSRILLALGFDPLSPVYFAEEGFTEDELRFAMFEAPRSSDSAGDVDFTGDVNGVIFYLYMQLKSIQLHWVQSRRSGDDRVDPCWYLQGFVIPDSEYNPNSLPIQMHAAIWSFPDPNQDNPEGAGEAYVQIVQPPTNERLRYLGDDGLLLAKEPPTPITSL